MHLYNNYYKNCVLYKILANVPALLCRYSSSIICFNYSFAYYRFTEQDAFVGYQEDTCAAIVYSCVNESKHSGVSGEKKVCYNVV